MHEESALERQCGPVAHWNDERPAKSTLAPDALWDAAYVAFRRMRAQGLTDAEAAEVFKPFLGDPARADAARFVLDLYGVRG